MATSEMFCVVPAVMQVDRADRLGERRKIALVTHAPQEELDRALLRVRQLDRFLGLQVIVECLTHLRRRSEAVRRLPRQGTMKQMLQLVVERVGQDRGQRDVRRSDFLHHLMNVAAADRTLASEQLVKNQSHGKDIRLLVAHPPRDVLRSHIRRCPR